MSIDWVDVLKISASSSVLTASIGWGLNYAFVHRAILKRDARYLAQRIAIILEKYAVDCADCIADNELHDSSEGHAGKQHVTLPRIGSFPAEAEWRTIAPDLVDRVLSMPNELALADHAILFWWDVVGDEDCMRIETNHQAGQCGLRAWLLASELRRRCGIPASTLPAMSWDFVITLRKHAEVAEAHHRKKRDDKCDESPIATTEG